MMMQKTTSSDALRRLRVAVIAPLLVAALAGCGGRDSDLEHFIQTTKHAAGGRVQPLPEIKPYEAFAYTDQNMRSPFVPGGSGNPMNAVRPDSHRSREYLEQFSLDTLKMVGTLNLAGNHYALVQTKDRRVHRVIIGEYMGQNDGKVTQITPSRIALTEVVPDGLGGYVERPAALALNE